MRTDLLYDPARHQPLRPLPWDESQVLAAIEHIVVDTESRFTEDRYWPLHPLDREGGDETEHFETALYDGACGVFWALQLPSRPLGRPLCREAMPPNWIDSWRATVPGSANPRSRDRASFMIGDTPIQMMSFGEEPTEELESALATLIAGNIEHPARELMWGSPGTLLAALFLYEHTGKQRWSDLFRLTAGKLWSQLEWSPQHLCSYWTQDFYGRQSAYLDAVHGFVATALPLIRGRHLLDVEEWNAWERCIVNTVQRTADRVGAHANWRPQLDTHDRSQKKLLQFCHGAPGFVICLAGLPSHSAR